MRKRVLVCVTAMLLVLAICASASAGWIKTNNGKPANGRRQPTKEAICVCTIPYGTYVETEGQTVDGYIYVPDWGCWILRSLIVNSDPGPFKPSSKPSGGKSSGTSTSAAQNGIYAEFKAARWVNPYAVTTYHKRSSGTINMRWAPAKNAPLIQTYRSGESLTVLCELKDWYQVEDPDTGKVGFIRRDYLQK